MFSKLLYFLLYLDLGKNGDAYEVILSPGDILIVPAHWWHYVESLETSLAINTWIPVVKKKKILKYFEYKSN